MPRMAEMLICLNARNSTKFQLGAPRSAGEAANDVTWFDFPRPPGIFINREQIAIKLRSGGE